jgi:hypothetical protein
MPIATVRRLARLHRQATEVPAATTLHDQASAVCWSYASHAPSRYAANLSALVVSFGARGLTHLELEKVVRSHSQAQCCTAATRYPVVARCVR